MAFQTITLAEYCPSIEYKFMFEPLRDTDLINILIISFHGNYRDGSTGRADAGFIKGIVTTGIAVFDPFSVLIDLSDLVYEWGDNLDVDFEETGNTRTAVLVGSGCRRAMSTLCFGVDTTKDIVDNSMFFDEEEKALEKLRKRDYFQ
jgi:hypothetical protein